LKQSRVLPQVESHRAVARISRRVETVCGVVWRHGRVLQLPESQEGLKRQFLHVGYANAFQHIQNLKKG